jgi:signal transduction histidine kinase
MFRLLRFFSIASLLAFLIVTVLLGFLYRRTAIQELSTQEERKNLAVTQAFVNALHPQLIAYLSLTQGLTTDELRALPALGALQQTVASLVADLPVAKIKIYNAGGNTIFSTRVGEIGEDQHANGGFLAARAGSVVSELTPRATRDEFDGVVEDQDVLATYFPVRSQESLGNVLGVFELYSNETLLLDRIDTTQRNLVTGVALILTILYAILFLVVRHADSIIQRQHTERIHAEEELRRQQRTLVTLRERERLARELHDSVGQMLGYLNTQAQAVSILWAQGQTQDAHRLLQRLVEVVQHAHAEVRQQIQSLQSGATYRLDFAAALEQYMVEFRQECDVGVELVNIEKWLDKRVDHNTETQLLRIVQEALTNVRKHAGATHARVTLDINNEQALVTVTDDGNGFVLDQIPAVDGPHFGLRMMHDRAQEIGGSVEVQSVPGHGTRVQVMVPVSMAGERQEFQR